MSHSAPDRPRAARRNEGPGRSRRHGPSRRFPSRALLAPRLAAFSLLAVALAGAGAAVATGLQTVPGPVVVGSVEPAQSAAWRHPGAMPEPTGLWIVRLAEPPLATYRGGLPGLPATSPEVSGERRLDVGAAPSVAYRGYLETRQHQLTAAMNQALGRQVEVRFQYFNVVNGLAVRVSDEEAARIAALPGVAAVYRDVARPLDTDVSHDLIGSASIWDGDTLSGVPTRGEGVLVGFLDTGVNPGHPAFAATDGDGYTHTNPFGSGNFVGVCDPLHPNHEDICNDKLIGAWNFQSSSPNAQDANDHGSHVGSTIAGNKHEASFSIGGQPFLRTVQGVAPRANVISYLVCFPSCPESSSVAAVDQAIADGVDVLNYSISGADNPWNDIVDLAFLDAFAAGMVVVASAGNDGPGAGTVAKTGPWNSSVAATTHERIFANTLDVTAPSMPAELQGVAAVPGSGPAIGSDIQDEILWAGDVAAGNVRGCSSFPGGSFSGAIALIQRGDCTFATKVGNAAAAGAVAVVVYNHVAGPPIVMGGLDATTIPAVMIDDASGLDLVDFVSGLFPSPSEVRINAAVTMILNPAWEDVVAGFSSRGPSQFDMLAPTFAAPGVNILAAAREIGGDPTQYTILQGTSMSSPHGAGAAALLVALNPTWTPAEIRSALATTAEPTGLVKEDGVTPADPFDIGSGRLDLGRAGHAALVLDETTANFIAANPATGGDPRTLNLPAMVDRFCGPSCSWTRAVRSVLPASSTWDASVEVTTPGLVIEVDPPILALGTGGSASFEVTVDVTGLPVAEWAFGAVVWTSLDGPDARLPIAVLPVTSTNALALRKEVDKEVGAPGETLTYEIVVANPALESRTFALTDPVPAGTTYVPGSATGGLVFDAGTDTLSWSDTLDAADLAIVEGTGFGYISLAGLGVSPAPCPSNCDEGGFIISGLDFFYLGQHYTRVIWSINGTLEAGTASGVAASWQNQELPNPALPNNIIAPWWADLELSSSGNWYVANVVDGPTTYHVFEWEDAPLWSGYGNPATFTFQIWIESGTDNIWFAYGPMDTASWDTATVGAEDASGSIGTSRFYNGSGIAPAAGDELFVLAELDSRVFTFQVTVDDPAPDAVVNVVEAEHGGVTDSAWAGTAIEAGCAADLTLTGETIDSAITYLATESITAGNGFAVGPTGDVTFHAGMRVVLTSGFAVESGGQLTVIIGPPGCP